MPEQLTGTIDKVIFRNDENGYTVASVKRDEFTYDIVVFTAHEIDGESSYRFEGDWKIHPRYGKQFIATLVNEILPEKVEDIEIYLSSKFVDGIGDALAKRIVEEFGEKTLEILDSDIEQLGKIKGIGKKKLETIKEIWEEQKNSRAMIMFLQSLGITPGYSTRIYRLYGANTRVIVEKNPYRLMDDIQGIGFLKADNIAMNMGIAPDSPWRIEAAISHFLQETASQEGHVFYPSDKLIQKGIEMLNVDQDAIMYALGSLQNQEKIFADNNFPLDDDVFPVYHRLYYYFETGIVEDLNRLRSISSAFVIKDLDNEIEQIFRNQNFEPSDEQIGAIKKAATEKLLIITGGPGTGKTTIISTILKLYNKMKKKVLLAAPTGRAAKKMTEATGFEAKTIHRLLEFNPVERVFARDEENPLEADLIVIDETSMVDNQLFYNLLNAIPTNASVLFVGDVDQLPSVGPGNILKDLIDSGEIETIKLTKIFRQAEQSRIITNSHRINRGEMPDLEQRDDSDFYFIRTAMPQTVLDRVVQLVSKDLPEKFGLDPFTDIQVLAPMYRTAAGVDNLNIALQEAVNPLGKEIGKGNPPFRIFDKVMQTKNNYEKEVFNGDIGKISQYDHQTKKVTVRFDDKIVKYELSEMDELSHAYAISVHKSQGSEYPCVIIPVLREFSIMLQRKLIYTALTRAKNMAIMLGNEQALYTAVKNNRSSIRYTLLKERLKRADYEKI